MGRTPGDVVWKPLARSIKGPGSQSLQVFVKKASTQNEGQVRTIFRQSRSRSLVAPLSPGPELHTSRAGPGGRLPGALLHTEGAAPRSRPSSGGHVQCRCDKVLTGRTGAFGNSSWSTATQHTAPGPPGLETGTLGTVPTVQGPACPAEGSVEWEVSALNCTVATSHVWV